MDYKHRCVDCGSPCGYTGLFNSAECSNANCKNYTPANSDTKAATPQSMPDPHALAVKNILPSVSQQAHMADFFLWVAGGPNRAQYQGDALHIGLWDEGFNGDPPSFLASMKCCVAQTTYVRGAPGWEGVSYRSQWGMKNKHDIKIVVPRITEVSHVVFGDAEGVFFSVQNHAGFQVKQILQPNDTFCIPALQLEFCS